MIESDARFFARVSRHRWPQNFLNSTPHPATPMTSKKTTVAPPSLDWHEVVKATRDAIVTIDARGVILGFNLSAEKMFRCSACDVIGGKVEALMPEPARAEHPGHIERYLRTGESKAIGQIRSVEGLRADGERFPMELSVSALRGEVGPVFVAILRDTSDAHRMRSAQAHTLEALDAYRHLVAGRDRRDDFAALTAQLLHDLGNPIAGLSAQAQLLRARARRDPDAPLSSIAPTAALIVDEAHRLSHQLRELMTFSRRQHQVTVTAIDANQFLQKILALWGPIAEKSAISLTSTVDRVHTLFADREKLHRVVENLIKNAIEALTQGGRVEIALTPASRGVELRVEDDGPGISDSIELFRLFETTKALGSGLGLTLARQFARAHGGDLRHEVVTPHGARFILSLPNALDPSAKNHAPSPLREK